MINNILRSPAYNKHIISSIKLLLKKGEINNIYYEIIKYDHISKNALSELTEVAIEFNNLNIILEPISKEFVRKIIIHLEYFSFNTNF